MIIDEMSAAIELREAAVELKRECDERDLKTANQIPRNLSLRNQWLEGEGLTKSEF